jgi:membrane dipeptidase
VADVANVIEHIRKVAGVEHVGIGADLFDEREEFDGRRGCRTRAPIPVLFAELLRRGWSEEDLLKLAGRNHLRAMRQMERVAAEMQRVDAARHRRGAASPLTLLPCR